MNADKRRSAGLFLIDRLVFLLPEIESTQQSCCVIDTFCLESGHRTGGRMFRLSRTISDNRLVARKLADVVQDFAGGNETRARNVGMVVFCLTTNVDDYGRSILQHGFQLFNRYSTSAIGVDRLRTLRNRFGI